MFPVAAVTSAQLIGSLWLGFYVPVGRLFFKDRRWIIAFIVPLVIAGLLIFGDPADEPWEGVTDLVEFGALAILGGLSLAVGAAIHFFWRQLAISRLVGGTAVVVAVLAGAILETQRVPDAACATQSVDVKFSDGSMRLPVEMYSQLVVPEVARWLDYRKWSENLVDKRDVRAICELSKSGAVPIAVTHFVLHLWPHYKEARFGCPTGLSEYCEGLPDGEILKVSQISVRDAALVAPDRSARLGPDEGTADVRGTEHAGSTCKENSFVRCPYVCLGWRDLPNGSSISVRSSCLAEAKADPRRHDAIEQAMDWLEAHLAKAKE